MHDNTDILMLSGNVNQYHAFINEFGNMYQKKPYKNPHAYCPNNFISENLL